MYVMYGIICSQIYQPSHRRFHATLLLDFSVSRLLYIAVITTPKCLLQPWTFWPTISLFSTPFLDAQHHSSDCSHAQLEAFEKAQAQAPTSSTRGAKHPSSEIGPSYGVIPSSPSAAGHATCSNCHCLPLARPFICFRLLPTHHSLPGLTNLLILTPVKLAYA